MVATGYLAHEAYAIYRLETLRIRTSIYQSLAMSRVDSRLGSFFPH